MAKNKAAAAEIVFPLGEDGPLLTIGRGTTQVSFRSGRGKIEELLGTGGSVSVTISGGSAVRDMFDEEADYELVIRPVAAKQPVV